MLVSFFFISSASLYCHTSIKCYTMPWLLRFVDIDTRDFYRHEVDATQTAPMATTCASETSMVISIAISPNHRYHNIDTKIHLFVDSVIGCSTFLCSSKPLSVKYANTPEMMTNLDIRLVALQHDFSGADRSDHIWPLHMNDTSYVFYTPYEICATNAEIPVAEPNSEWLLFFCTR